MQGLSPYIYGIHDPGGESILAGKGQVLITESIGANADSVQGADYTHLAQQGLGVIVRLNYSHHGEGTIPRPEQYAEFAETCARFVAQSRGSVIWIIGNEPNHPNERPQGKPIAPQDYGACFRLCRAAIKQVGSQHQVMPAAVGPWNAKTKYPGNESGDWVQYFVDMLYECGEFDGVALHAYTRGASPAMVFSEQRMNAPFQHRRVSFRVYQDFLDRVPAHLRHLPVLITEIDEYDAWTDANTGVVQAIYQEINAWNQSGGQPILAGVLYRWLNHDKWGFRHKSGVHADLRAAIAKGYQAPQGKAQAAQEQKQAVYMPNIARGNVAPVTDLPPREWDARLTQHGIELTEYQPEPGEVYIRLIKGEYWEEKEHTFVETLGKDGKRLPGLTLRWWWGNGNHDQEGRKVTELKPNDRWMVDFPMFNAGRSYGLEVLGYPSDRIFGMGLGSVEKPDWNMHVSYKFTFQLTVAPAASQPKPHPEPEPQAEKPEGQQPMNSDKLTRQLATVLDIDPAVAQAVLAVESGNQAFVNGRMVIRFENHIFWREWGKHSPDVFDRHFKFNRQGKSWTGHQWRPDGGTWRACHASQEVEWQVFEFARKLDETAAMRSMSMGAAQIMGFNHARVNYPTVQELFHSYQASRTNQVMGFFFFVDSDPALVNALRQRDFLTFARGYNGTGQPEYYADLIEAKLRE